MRYMVVKSQVQVIGHIWQPGVGTCAMTYSLSSYDLENARDENGKFTREGIQDWLDKNAGDFRSVDDFAANIADGAADVVIPWASEESEVIFGDCMFGGEE